MNDTAKASSAAIRNKPARRLLKTSPPSDGLLSITPSTTPGAENVNDSIFGILSRRHQRRIQMRIGRINHSVEMRWSTTSPCERMARKFASGWASSDPTSLAASSCPLSRSVAA